MTEQDINNAIGRIVAEHEIARRGLVPKQRPPGTKGYKCDLSGLWILTDAHGATTGYNHKTPERAIEEFIREYQRKPYNSSRDAMAEAEEVLTEDQWYEYDRQLPAHFAQKIHATASQRAKAFLRVFGVDASPEPKTTTP